MTQILELYRSCEGKTGLDAHDKFTAQLFDAFSVIESGKAKRYEAEELKRKAEEKNQHRGRR